MGGHRGAGGSSAPDPGEDLERLHRCYQEPHRHQAVTELASTPVICTPAEFRVFIADDRAKWQRLAKQANLAAQ